MGGFADIYHRLAALTELAAGKGLSQRSLASRLGISLGAANALLRRLETEGFIAVNRLAAAQVLRYALTESGRAELNRLALEFASRAETVLDGLRAEIQRRAGRLRAENGRRALLCGSGPLADMAASALLSAGFRLVGVVSTELNVGSVAGVKMRPFAEAGKIDCDVGIAVTESDAKMLRRRLGRRVPVTQLLSGGTRAEDARG